MAAALMNAFIFIFVVKENIPSTNGSFTACVNLHADDRKNIIPVNNSRSGISYTAVSIQEILSLAPVIGTHAFLELFLCKGLLSLGAGHFPACSVWG